MKQERRKSGGHERDQAQRDSKREQREPKTGAMTDSVTEEPARRLDGPATDDSFRGMSDGEILSRYEF
jgi:hypothetical protein